ncbi:MAG TPA: hypothetical protein VK527_08000 [Candidatus Limnocylindrales bacterium]|nr:hypothetical protein [Candidatus Limnocylindrales bacterium]
MANPFELQPGRSRSTNTFPGGTQAGGATRVRTRAASTTPVTTRAYGGAAGQPGPSHLHRALHAFTGLLALCVFALVVVAPFLIQTPRARFEIFGGVSEFRLWGLMLCTALLMIRFMFSPPRKPSLTQLVWGQFAVACGGSLTDERRRQGPMGMIGGPTVRWATRGVDVRLWMVTDSGLNDHTLMSADVRLARG